MKILYEINWHGVDSSFTHCTVTPITVLREGCSPGCSAVSITAKDAAGRVFHGSPGDYFPSEEEAWKNVVETLDESLVGLKAAAEETAQEIESLDRYLRSLRK